MSGYFDDQAEAAAQAAATGLGGALQAQVPAFAAAVQGQIPGLAQAVNAEVPGVVQTASQSAQDQIPALAGAAAPAARQVGNAAGAGAREGAVGGLGDVDWTTVGIGAGAVAVLGLAFYAAVKSGPTADRALDSLVTAVPVNEVRTALDDLRARTEWAWAARSRLVGFNGYSDGAVDPTR